MKKPLALICLTVLVCLSTNLISAQTKSNGMLYKITGKNLKKPSYLFGTIHITCQKDMILQDKLDEYINQTEQVVLELDMDDENVVKEMGKTLYMPEGKSWVNALSAEKLAKVNETMIKLTGAPAEKFKQIRPTMLIISFTANEKSLGCPIGSYESSIVKSATGKKKPVEGLESVETQVNALLNKPVAEEAESLYKFALNPQEGVDSFKKLSAVYHTQDSDNVYDYFIKQSGSNPQTVEKLLTVRNIDWIPKMQTKINNKPTFFAVGAAHLGGKKGVINLLRKKGYKLTPIKL